MTKNDIAVELCKRIPDLPKSTALHVVEGVTDILSDAFYRGENVYLRGFGTLSVVDVKERPAVHFKTKEQIIVPAHRSVKFRLSKELKEKLNS